MDVHVDTRQVVPGCLRAALLRALARSNAPEPQNQDRLPLEQFQSLRSSIVWEFNKLYWSRLHDWEAATGKGYEQALPGGQSDGHHPEAIADSVGDFWTLLRDLESKNQLPAGNLSARNRRRDRNALRDVAHQVPRRWIRSAGPTTIRSCESCWAIIRSPRWTCPSPRWRITPTCAASWCWTR